MDAQPQPNDARGATLRNTANALQTFALDLPGAYEEFPWGERVAKVNKKVFVFWGLDSALDTQLRFSVKLPISGEDVLVLPFAALTGYGLGKSGWVTLCLYPDDLLPLDQLRRWVVESYRAVAPKRLAARVDGSAAM